MRVSLLGLIWVPDSISFMSARSCRLASALDPRTRLVTRTLLPRSSTPSEVAPLRGGPDFDTAKPAGRRISEQGAHDLTR